MINFRVGGQSGSTAVTDLERQRQNYAAALSHLRSGDAGRAAELCDLGLRDFPEDANMLCLSAKANLALRRFDLCRQRLGAALRIAPDFANAHDISGDLLLVEGRGGDAANAYEQAIRLDPARPSTLAKLEKARELGRQDATATGTAAARAPRPQMAFADEMRQAEQFERDGAADKAEEIYRRVLKKDPDHVEASRLLAGIAVAHERYRDAEVFLRRAVTLAPDYPRAWVDLANVQRELEDFEGGIASAERVLELSPDMPESHMLYASLVGVAGRHEQAIEVYERVLAMAPDKAGAMCSMAHHLKTIGRTDAAISRYRACIAVKPDHSEAYWSLANLKTFRFDDAEVAAMETLLERSDLPDTARDQVHNALGLEYEARGDFDRAFANFERCNVIRRRAESYDPVDTEATHDRVIDLFTKEMLAGPAAPESGTTPIFIVGLPRSGSTLIEQILASHSQVEGTHELSDLSRTVQALKRRAPNQLRFPEFLARMNTAGWHKIGRDYLQRTEKYRAGAPYFIDKNPNNFVFAGVLKLALPNAKIINARRHPLDSCLGTYKQLFASGQPFSYDMTELGEYYLQYQRLMDHWHDVMPGCVLDVHYEDVVADLEGQVRRLLDFCGLPFESACLRFHETERAVKTASSEQVRQPIYSSSVHLWRNYEPHLQPLVHILKPVLPSISGADQAISKGNVSRSHT